MTISTRFLRTAVAATALALTSALPALAETLLIHAGRVLDKPGNAVRGATTITVTDGRIVSLENGYRNAADRSVRVINLRDQFVMPGLIDSHVHLTSDTGGIASQLEGVTLSPARQAFNAYENGLKTLNAGFTTVRNLGDRDGAVIALRDAVNAGQVMGPRILDSGRSLSGTSGHTDSALGFREELRPYFEAGGSSCNGAEECRRAVRLQISRGADVIKVATTGGVNSRIGAGLGRQMFEDEVRAIVETARLFDRKVSAHAHGADGIRLALEAGVDSIEHGTILDPETIDAFVASGAYYVPTLSTVNGYIERMEANPDAYAPDVRAKIEWRIGITGKSLEVLHANGVKVAYGTDAGVSKHGRNADEFELLVRFGMSPLEAIEAATVNAADLLGLSDEIGTLEAGKSADLIAVRGNPLEDVTVFKTVNFVMVRGQVAKE
ncbi:MAG: amidohydrolase family protein [Hyphomonas sp.]